MSPLQVISAVIFILYTLILEFFWAVDPVTSKLDEEQRMEYLVDIFVHYKKEFADFEEENGKIKMPYTLFVIYGSKPK